MSRLALPEQDLPDAHARNARALEAWADQLLPAGAIQMYGGATDPLGWLICDGRAVSRREHANLFAAIGTTFGAGDGSTTFNIPDLRQRFPLGKAASGTGSTLGGTGGTIDHPHDGHSAHTASSGHSNHAGHSTHAANASHAHDNHNVAISDHTSADNTTAGGGAHRTTSEAHGGSHLADGSHTHDAHSAHDGHSAHTASSNHGSHAAANPPFLALNFIVKV